MAFDPIRNHAIATITTGYDIDDVTIVLASGHGAYLPDPATEGAFNLVWWNSTDYKNPSLDPLKEIVRVTARSGDTLTVTRPAIGNLYNGEGSDNAAHAHNITGRQYKFVLTPTRKYMADFQGELNKKATIATVGFSDAQFICDGVNDNVQLQEAIDYVLANGGGTVLVRKGDYYLSTNLLIIGDGLIFRGEGAQATNFHLNDEVNRELIVVGDAVTSCNDISFYDFFLDGNKSHQTGSVYSGGTRNLLRYRSDAQNSYGGVVDNVHAYNGKQNGISIESHAFVTVRNCIAELCDQFGFWCENGGQIETIGCNTKNNTFSGYKYLSASGKFIGNESKGDKGGGFSFQDFSGPIIGNIAARAGWQGSDPSFAVPGFNISLSNGLIFTGNRSWGSYGHGLVLNGVTKSVITGNTFERNGQQTDNTYADIYITNAGGGAAVTDNIISDNTFDNHTEAYYPNTVAYNIQAHASGTHIRNTFGNNKYGTPLTAGNLNIASGNFFINDGAINPIGYHNYGFVNPSISIDPSVDGDLLRATGFANAATVVVADGKWTGQKFRFIFWQDTSGRKQITTWTGNIVWSGGSAPLFIGAPSSYDIIDFTWESTHWVATHNGSSSMRPYVAKSADYTAVQSDSVIDCSGTMTLTLPRATSSDGKIFTIKNTGTGIITIATTISQTIDGALTYLLTAKGQSITVQSNGANWITIVEQGRSPRVVDMADATSFTPTGNTADINTHTNTQAIGTLTANAPTGNPVQGQMLLLQLKTTNVQTFSWNAIYRGSNDVALPTASTGSSKTDKILFQYNATDTKWDIVAKSLGY